MRKLFFILWAVFSGLLVTFVISHAMSYEPNFMDFVGLPLTVIFLPIGFVIRLADHFVGPLNRATELFIMTISGLALCPAYAKLICLIAQKVKARKLFFILWAVFIGIWVIYMICWGIILSHPAPLARALASFLTAIFIPALLLSFLAESLFGYLDWTYLFIIFFSSFVLCLVYAALISFIVQKIKARKAAKKP